MGEISNGDGCRNDWGAFCQRGEGKEEREKGDIGKEKEKGVPKVKIVQYFFLPFPSLNIFQYILPLFVFRFKSMVSFWVMRGVVGCCEGCKLLTRVVRKRGG